MILAFLRYYLLGRFHAIPACCCVQWSFEQVLRRPRSAVRMAWAVQTNGRVPCAVHVRLLGAPYTRPGRKKVVAGAVATKYVGEDNNGAHMGQNDSPFFTRDPHAEDVAADPPHAADPIPPVRWGRDHYSTIAYAFSCLGNGGTLEAERLRRDGEHWPTRLRDGSLMGHNDLDCLADAQAAGVLVMRTTLSCQFTPEGLKLGQWLCSSMRKSEFRLIDLSWAIACEKSGFTPLPKEPSPCSDPT